MIFEPQVINLDAVIDEYVNVSVSEENTVSVNADVTVTHAQADYYEGEYVVIPRANDSVVLETRDKLLTDDVTVTKVPYYQTHNETGETVFIASEV